MSKLDAKRLGNVISNVFHEVVSNTTITIADDNVKAIIRAAQINVTAIIVATLIEKGKDIYYDDNN